MMVHGILNGDLELVLLKQSPNWSSLVSSRAHDRKRTTLSDSHNYFLVDSFIFFFFLFINFTYVMLYICAEKYFSIFLQTQRIHTFGLVHVRFILYFCNLRLIIIIKEKETGIGILSFLFSSKKYFSTFFVYKSLFYVLFYVFHVLYFPSVNSRTKKKDIV